jgi:DUF1009 family protein
VQKTIGLIAGNGNFPLEFARAASEQGMSVFALAIKEETEKSLGEIVDKIEWVGIGELDKIIRSLKLNNITEVVMAGKITKTRMFSEIPMDFRWEKIFKNAGNNNDDTLLLSVVKELEKENIKTIKSTTYLDSLLPEKGILTNTVPSDKVWSDLRYGHYMAKKIAGMDIGQTVVVKNCAVLAVEAIEGTDQCILRGGELGRGSVVIAKVSKPNQDLRFDVPVVGLTTIESMLKAGAVAIIMDAGKTILLDRQKVIQMADENGIAIVSE